MGTLYQNLDIFNQQDFTGIVLCNPNKEELFMIGSYIYNTQINLKYNALSEFSFTIPKSIDNSETTLEPYSYVKVKRLIKIEQIGYFIITDVQENNEGSVVTSEVSCVSLEAELMNKRVVGYEGDGIKFYTAGDSTTLLQHMLDMIPNWSAGTVSTTLAGKARSFTNNDTNIYNFLMNDVAKAFDCVFEFDTFNRTISSKLITELSELATTNIYLSHDNLIKSSNFSEFSDEIATALACYGGGNDLTIANVNPLGSNMIYNFDYYKNTNWMSQGLINAINAWEAKYDLAVNNIPVGQTQSIYSKLSEDILNKYIEIETWENIGLANRQNDYDAQNTILSASVEAKMPTDKMSAILKLLNDRTSTNEATALGYIQSNIAELDWVGGDYNTWKTEDWDVYHGIKQINDELVTLNNELTVLLNERKAIVDDLDIETNLGVYYNELIPFIYENTYQNENIIITDSMTASRIQEESQRLYDQSLVILQKTSQPRYEFSIDLANFINLVEYKPFVDEMTLGRSVTIAGHDANFIAVLLEIQFSFDKPEEMSLTFSNRFRLDNGNFQYSDLLGEAVKAGGSVSFGKLKWENFDSNYKTDVDYFLTSALDASKNAVINASNQQITINESGLQGRKLTNGAYEDEQLWMTSNMLAFTDDGWTTAKLGIGKVQSLIDPNATVYGIVGEQIVGNIIAGNNLTIQNETGSFIVNNAGLTITDLNMTLYSGTNKTKMVINNDSSTSLFLVQKDISQTGTPTWEDRFSITADGNVTMKGEITATTGTIGGFTITENEIKADDTHYFNSSTNKLKWGDLKVEGDTLTVTNLQGSLDWSNLNNVPASQLSSGTFGGAGTYGFPGGVNFGIATEGQIRSTTNGIGLYAGVINLSGAVYHSGGAFRIGGNNDLTVADGGTIYIGNSEVSSKAYVDGTELEIKSWADAKFALKNISIAATYATKQLYVLSNGAGMWQFVTYVTSVRIA